jgi:hypothetical protein
MFTAHTLHICLAKPTQKLSNPYFQFFKHSWLFLAFQLIITNIMYNNRFTLQTKYVCSYSYATICVKWNGNDNCHKMRENWKNVFSFPLKQINNSQSFQNGVLWLVKYFQFLKLRCAIQCGDNYFHQSTSFHHMSNWPDSALTNRGERVCEIDTECFKF